MAKDETRQLLRDAAVPPTAEVLADALGGANGAYVRFLSALQEHGIQLDWRYYTDGKAWLGKGLCRWVSPRGTQKELTAFWLSVWDGFFRVSVFVPEKARADALALPLGAHTQDMVRQTKPMGKLKFFPLLFDVYGEEDAGAVFADIFALAGLKKRLK